MSNDFGKGMKAVIANLPTIMAVSELLTQENLEAIAATQHVDWEKSKEIMKAHDRMINNMDLFQEISNGMNDIQNVAKMQNQVWYLSDMRHSLGQIAGTINTQKLDELFVLKEMMTKIVDANIDENMINKLVPLLEQVVLMKDEIGLVSEIAESIGYQTKEIKAAAKKANAASIHATDMVNKANIIEARIDEKLKRMEELEKNTRKLNINVTYVEAGQEPISHFDEGRGILHIQIPIGPQGPIGKEGKEGKQGPKGVPGSVEFKGEVGEQGPAGRDGKDFNATAYGSKTERARFNGHPPGTSFIVLDETPAMVYFRIGNASGNWTEGQPFGIAEGLKAGTADNADRLNGYTAQELLQFIQRKITGAEDGK